MLARGTIMLAYVSSAQQKSVKQTLKRGCGDNDSTEYYLRN